MAMDPMSGGPPYATGEPQQATGGGGVCGICGRELPPPDLEAVAASIDHTLSLETGRMVPRTAWAGRPPDGLLDGLLFWMPSVKASRQLWERGQALWAEQMTAALSGPCGDCQGAIPEPPDAPSPYLTQSTGSPTPTAGPTAYLPYEPSPPAAQRGQELPATAYLPAHDDGEAMTSAVPAYADFNRPSSPAEPAPPPPMEDLPTSAVPSFSTSFGGSQPSTQPPEASPPPTAPVPPPVSDEHESHTVILSALPSVRTGTRLVVLEGPVRGRQFSLGRVRTTIGRSIGCHVTVEADSVEYDHATIVRAGDGWQIERSRSASELQVNDEPVQGPRALKSGDVIRIGPARLRFESAS